jgi:Arc/MetJ family transcription regulator
LPSKRAAVELALRRLAGEPMSRDEALAMEGAGWSGDLDDLREPDAATGSGDAPAAGS